MAQRTITIDTLIDKIDPEHRKEAYTPPAYEFEATGRNGKPRTFTVYELPNTTYPWAV